MEFVETPLFTKLIYGYMTPEDFQALQGALIENPESGKLIPGSGGLRKLRWFSIGKGKRGGLRVIYYWYASEDLIYFLYAYRKSDREELTHDEIKFFSKLLEDE